MPYDEDQIANLEADVDDLVTPTTEDVLAYSQDYDAGIVAASALQKSLNGGGGGGGSFNGGTITEPLIIENSLAVTGGIFTQLAPEGNNGVFFDVGSWDGNNELTIAQSLAGAGRLEYWDGGDVVFEIGPGGAVTIVSDGNDDALTVQIPVGSSSAALNLYSDEGTGSLGWSLAGGLEMAPEAGANQLVKLWDADNNPIFVVGPTGAVTISPSEGGASLTFTGTADQYQPLFIAYATEDGSDGVQINEDGSLSKFSVDGTDTFTVGPSGAVTISPSAIASGAAPLDIYATADGHALIIRDPDDNIVATFYRGGGANFTPTDEFSSVQLNGGTLGSVSFALNDDVKIHAVAAEGQTAALLTLKDSATVEVFTVGPTGDLGFYGNAPVAKPTGVTVDAAGIHAALVTLGLITA